MMYVSPLLNVIIAATDKAGKVLSKDFNELEQLQSSVKDNSGFINASLKNFEQNLRYELNKARPTFAIIKNQDKLPDAPCFVVELVDGMNNYINGIAQFAVCIAAVEKGVLTSGVIYNPATDDLYFAEKGLGAFKRGYRNNERLRVSACKEIEKAVVAVQRKFGQVVSPKIASTIENIRISGSVALDLANVASGKFDAALSFDNSFAAAAAGLLLVKEAGGHVYDINEQDLRSEDIIKVMKAGNFMAVNDKLGKKLQELLKK